jgi:hypothetical protein
MTLPTDPTMADIIEALMKRPKTAVVVSPVGRDVVGEAVDRLRAEGHDIDIVVSEHVEPGTALVANLDYLFTPPSMRPDSWAVKVAATAAASDDNPFRLISPA